MQPEAELLAKWLCMSSTVQATSVSDGPALTQREPLGVNTCRHWLSDTGVSKDHAQDPVYAMAPRRPRGRGWS